jgi:four helix bundle protein
MSSVQQFEDLEIWQKARDLAKEINSIAQNSPLNKDYALKDQIQRSAGSVMDNIAEGFERGGRQEFIQFLAIAKGSCGEVRSQLHRAIDNSYINNELFESLYNKCISISKMISNLIEYLKKTDYKGIKYK